MKTRRTSSSKEELFESTKDHALIAGRELLLAAQGMLKFCKLYVESSSDARFKPYLSDLISKAQNVTDDLAKDIVRDVPVKKQKSRNAATGSKKEGAPRKAKTNKTGR